MLHAGGMQYFDREHLVSYPLLFSGGDKTSVKGRPILTIESSGSPKACARELLMKGRLSKVGFLVKVACFF